VTPPFQRLDQLEEALRGEGVDPAPFAGVFASMRRHFRRYAALETGLLGGVTFPDAPGALEEIAGPPGAEAIERMARAERERLREDAPSSGNLMTLLDRDGVKVYRPVFPPEPVRGVFLFDPEVGPAMTVSAGLGPAQANAAFARLLGHYLIDNDPYRICFHIDGAGDAGRPAAVFGNAFLVGRELLRGYLAARGKAPLGPEAVLELAAYFEAPPALVVERLVERGALAPGKRDAVIRALPPREPGPEDGGRPQMSERFTRLALEANARAILTVDALAEHLETDAATARELASRFRMIAAGP
jgi:hypothetical protein